MRRAAQDGFTLIELLIVMVILGILAALVMMGLGTFKSDSSESACKADATTLHHAAAAYNAKHSAWPTGADGAARVQVLVDAGFIERAPTTGATLIDDAGDASC